MMKIVLLLYILTTSQTFAAKIKEVNGIPLPKGVVAKYDDLKDSYSIYLKTFFSPPTAVMMTYYDRNVELEIHIRSNNIRLFATTRFWTSIAQSIDQVTIYIRNPGKEKVYYSFPWLRELVSTGSVGPYGLAYFYSSRLYFRGADRFSG